MQNFTPISKAPAEKSVTVHSESKNATVNLVSRPYYEWRDNQHGIQPRIQNLDKTSVLGGVHSKEFDRQTSKVGNFLKCICLHFLNICLIYAENLNF